MNDLTKRIINFLSPVTGDFLARVRVDSTFVLLNIKSPTIEDLPKIANKLQQNLELSIGPVAAKEIADQVRNIK